MMSEKKRREKNIQSGELTKHWNGSFTMLVLPEWPVGILFLFSLSGGGSQFLSIEIPPNRKWGSSQSPSVKYAHFSSYDMAMVVDTLPPEYCIRGMRVLYRKM